MHRARPASVSEPGDPTLPLLAFLPRFTPRFTPFTPGFMRPDSADPQGRSVLLGSVLLTLGALLYFGYACAGGGVRRRLRRRPRALARRCRAVCGVCPTLGALGAVAARSLGP